MSFQNWYSSVK